MPPRLAIGLPVYNGAATVTDAVRSLLSQDVDALEVIVSDNGSTDDTPRLLRDLAASDPRVKVFREEANRGPVWNFNRVLEAGLRAPYFMWAAADDRKAPDFASSCIRRLEADPSTALCGTWAAFTRDARDFEYDLSGDTGTGGPLERAEAYLRGVDRNSIFYGVYRSAVLERRRLGNRIAGDHAFLLDLALEGRFQVVPELKFWRRGGGISRSVASIAATLGVPLRVPKWLARLEILYSMQDCIRELPGLSGDERNRLRTVLRNSTLKRFLRRRLGLVPKRLP